MCLDRGTFLRPNLALDSSCAHFVPSALAYVMQLSATHVQNSFTVSAVLEWQHWSKKTFFF